MRKRHKRVKSQLVENNKERINLRKTLVEKDEQLLKLQKELEDLRKTLAEQDAMLVEARKETKRTEQARFEATKK